MAGILDYLTGNDAAASPWGMLYQQPQPQTVTDYAMGFPVQMPASPWGDPSQSSVANPTAPPQAPIPATGFGAGASPFGFAGPGSMSGINPAMMAGAPAPAAPPVAQAPQPPATDLSSANRPAPAPQDQAEPLPVGKNYQMPRFGSADDFEPDDATPVNAKPTQGALPPAAPAPFSLGGAASGIGDRLGMAARGFMGNMGAGPIGALMAGTGSLLMGRESDPTAIARGNVNATGLALLKKGAPLEDVQAAVNNPTLMTSLLAQYYGKDKYKVVQTGEVMGQKTYQLFNETDGTFKDIPRSAAGGGGGAPGGLLAAGVTYDPNKSGEAYMAQFSPEAQDAAKAYLRGDVMPTGNARKDTLASQAKVIAQKYATDMGIPVSDSLYAEKRKYRTELGSNSPNSAGGQAKAFNQGISHLDTLATTLEKLDNSNGLGVPMIAQGVNSLRQGMSNEQSAISDEAKSLGQTVAGEVGKLFSGQAGGGVHERELTRERFDTVKSRPQLAAALRATVETMQGGLAALEQNRDRILGPDSGVDFVGNETRQKIAKIQGVIDRLEGRGGAAPPAAPGTAAIPPGWSVKVH